MRSHLPRLAAAGFGLAVLVGPLAGTAFAHERRTVGTLQFVVGWGSEPTFTGYLNGVQIFVRDGSAPGDPVPITDAADTLKVEVSFGDQKVGPLDLDTVFNSPGEYQAPLVPTRAGVYKFRFVGTVKGQQIDETFTSSDTTFASPGDTSEIEFPVKDPTAAELASRVERVDTRAATVAKSADDAKSKGSTAIALGAAGLALAVVALGATTKLRKGSKA